MGGSGLSCPCQTPATLHVATVTLELLSHLLAPPPATAPDHSRLLLLPSCSCCRPCCYRRRRLRLHPRRPCCRCPLAGQPCVLAACLRAPLVAAWLLRRCQGCWACCRGRSLPLRRLPSWACGAWGWQQLRNRQHEQDGCLGPRGGQSQRMQCGMRPGNA